MKRLLALLLLLAVLPAHAVTLKWAAQNDILTLDPHSQNHATTIAILQHTYESLVRYSKDYKIEPSLAESWKELSPTQWRFNLRKGVKFHDGSPFTAADVIATLDRVMDVKQRTGATRGDFVDLDSYRAVDALTVELKWKNESAFHLRARL